MKLFILLKIFIVLPLDFAARYGLATRPLSLSNAPVAMDNTVSCVKHFSIFITVLRSLTYRCVDDIFW